MTLTAVPRSPGIDKTGVRHAAMKANACRHVATCSEPLDIQNARSQNGKGRRLRAFRRRQVRRFRAVSGQDTVSIEDRIRLEPDMRERRPEPVTDVICSMVVRPLLRRREGV